MRVPLIEALAFGAPCSLGLTGEEFFVSLLWLLAVLPSANNNAMLAEIEISRVRLIGIPLTERCIRGFIHPLVLGFRILPSPAILAAQMPVRLRITNHLFFGSIPLDTAAQL